MNLLSSVSGEPVSKPFPVLLDEIAKLPLDPLGREKAWIMGVGLEHERGYRRKSLEAHSQSVTDVTLFGRRAAVVKYGRVHAVLDKP